MPTGAIVAERLGTLEPRIARRRCAHPVDPSVPIMTGAGLAQKGRRLKRRRPRIRGGVRTARRPLGTQLTAGLVVQRHGSDPP